MSKLQVAHICEWCKGQFFHVRSEQRFCSRACSNRATGERQRAARQLRECPQCGTAFDPEGSPKRFCGRVCASVGNIKPAEMRACLECRAEFVVPKGQSKRRLFCSLPCANHHTNRTVREKRTPEVRFWRRVNKNGPVPPCYPELGPCWIFANGNGYGMLSGEGGVNARSVLAHRFSFELANGQLPEAMLVCHKCDNPPCVNPDHLFLGTYLDNSRDMVAKGRQAVGEDAGPRPGRRAVGVRHGMRKLSEDDVFAIRAMLAKGESGVEIASQFGIAQTNVSMIRNRKTWKHLA